VAVTEGSKEDQPMADKCHKCGDISNGNCARCGRPVCRKHSKTVGEHVLCYECIDKAR